MSLTTKILLFLFGIFVVVAGTFVIYKQIEISQRQDAIENQIIAQKELADNIMRSMSQYASKEDIEKYAKDQNVNLAAIKDDLDKMNAKLVAINTVVTNSKGQTGTGKGSTGTTPNPEPKPVDPTNPDPHGYLSNRQEFELNEKFDNATVPFGKVGFSAWKDKPWDYNIYAREYQSTNVIGTDENQRHYIYNKFSVKVGDKTYDLKISKSSTLEEYPQAKFSFWNPRLYLGMDVGAKVGTVPGAPPARLEASPNINVSIMSYGKYKNQPDISVLQVGAGYGIDAKKPNISLTPIMYNVGKHIPLMNNLYIGPTVHLNTGGDVAVMGGVRVGL